MIEDISTANVGVDVARKAGAATLASRLYAPLAIAIGVALPTLYLLSLTSSTYYIYLLNLVLINAICAIGLCVLSGAAGQLSLGTAALQATGAYTVSILTLHYGVPSAPSLLVAGLVAMTVGTVLAAPALRLQGLQLPVLTMAAGVILVQMISKGGTLTGGTSGLSIPAFAILGFQLDSDYAMLCLIAPIFVLAAWNAWVFLELKPGRALRMLRFRDTTAQALGVNTAIYKVLAFAFSSFLIGIAGGLYAGVSRYVSVDDFTLWNSIYFFVMIAVGGMTSIVGAIIGAVFVTLLPEATRSVAAATPLIFGVTLLVINTFVPGGLVSLVSGARARLRPQANPQVPHE